MPNLNVTVRNEDRQPLPGVACTLLGVNPPQALPTGGNGQCSFQNLAAGNYRLLLALEGFNTKSAPVSITDADQAVSVTLNVVNEDNADDGRAFFRVLTAVQYAFLGLIGVVFSAVIIFGLYRNFNLSDDTAARGLITFLVAAVTVAIALILVMAAFLSGGKDVEKRFAFGKEVLTVLIGVLGTIMGFYYGQTASNSQRDNRNTNQSANQNASQNANQNSNGTTAQQQGVQITTPKLTPVTPQVGREFTLNTTISGGEKPYKYTVTFTPATAVAVAPQETTSLDGNISQKFTLTANNDLTRAPVTYKIDVKDNKGATATFDKGSFTPAAATQTP